MRCLSSTKSCLRILLICFAREIKGFYLSFLGNEVGFTDIMNVSPNILNKNSNFKKLRDGFVDKRTMITTALTSSYHWKTLVLFACERKYLKTHLNWLFYDMCKKNTASLTMIRRVFVLEYYLIPKLNISYYLSHYCYWVLYCWIDHKVGILLACVLSAILGYFWRNIQNLFTFLQNSHH